MLFQLNSTPGVKQATGQMGRVLRRIRAECVCLFTVRQQAIVIVLVSNSTAGEAATKAIDIGRPVVKGRQTGRVPCPECRRVQRIECINRSRR